MSNIRELTSNDEYEQLKIIPKLVRNRAIYDDNNNEKDNIIESEVSFSQPPIINPNINPNIIRQMNYDSNLLLQSNIETSINNIMNNNSGIKRCFSLLENTESDNE